jgi:beta-glucosidase
VESTVDRPDQELKAFAKVHLEPGATQSVALTLDRRAFATWDPDSHGWVVEAGLFEVRVGASSRDIRSRARIELAGDGVPLRPSPPSWAEAYGRPVRPNEPDRRGRYTVQTPMGDLRHPVARLFVASLIRIARFALRSTPDDPVVLIVGNLLRESPARMLPMITQGRLRLSTARALVAIANGWSKGGRRVGTRPS